MPDPAFTAEAGTFDGPSVHLSAPGVLYVLTVEEARALHAQLGEAIRAAEVAAALVVVPKGTTLRGVEPCDHGSFSGWDGEDDTGGVHCGCPTRLVLGFGVRVAGMLDLECCGCGERSSMRVEVAQQLLQKAGGTGGEGG